MMNQEVMVFHCNHCLMRGTVLSDDGQVGGAYPTFPLIIVIAVKERYAVVRCNLLELVLGSRVNTFIHNQEFNHVGNKYQYRK